MPDLPLAELRGVRRISVRLTPDLASDLKPTAAVFVGTDPAGVGLQVLIADWIGPGPPSVGLLRRLHDWRQAKKVFPLVTVIRRHLPDGGLPDRQIDSDAASLLREPGVEGRGLDRPADVQPSLLADPSAGQSVTQTWLKVEQRSSEESGGELLMLGPAAETPARLREEQAYRMLRAALEESAGTAARRRIVGLLKSAASEVDRPGLTNSGLFSAHYLLDTLPEEERWDEALQRARPLLRLRGHDLIRGLGFRIQERVAHVLVLATEQDEQRAVAVLLDRNETFDAESDRLAQSPAAYGLAKARQRNADWLILVRGDQIRLYSAEAGVGVGSRSRVETWLELDLAALGREHAAYLDLVFSAGALAREGTVVDLLAKSRQFATSLGGRLRQRIYEHVVPRLAIGVAEALDRKVESRTRGDLSYAYRLSLRILFRLLFQAYAEDRGLLPYGSNRRFDRHSLKRLAMTLAEEAKRQREAQLSTPGSQEAAFDAGATTLWTDLQTVWRAIDKGDRGMDVPAYNGGLFDTDPAYRPEGADLRAIELTDAAVGPALRDLLVDETPDGAVGPVDFRSLSVREFGTIYEGLLESELSRAEVDLTVDRKDVYRPAGPRDKVVVHAGEAYFHNRSGERKATGSYFTPKFAVEHLLDQALEPTLDKHLAEVQKLYDSGDEAAATERFWDFRVADIAMGSGHFLIAALDRIETRMGDFLSQRPLGDVTAELLRLERSALNKLASAHVEIERATLLRRQIARRCIYGVDLNETAVELARVAVWIHTFVPGLPISTLDHNLVCADSLTGIGTVDEALDVLDPDRGERQMSIYSGPILDAMSQAVEPLTDQANALEQDIAEVNRGREQLREAREKAEPARLLFDAAVAIRLGLVDLPGSRAVDDIVAVARRPDVAAEVREMSPAHMPALFPEVFTRKLPGFDALVGNPPWEKAKVEEHTWWTARFPGFKSLSTAERADRIPLLRRDRPDLAAEYDASIQENDRLRVLLLAGPYPGIGTGDSDLYQAFCWRFWHLVRKDGAVGVVLPRGALADKGASEWRQEVLAGGTFADVTLLLNKARWVFDMEPRYTVGLVGVRKGANHRGLLGLRGPYSSEGEYKAGMAHMLVPVPVDEFLTWSDSASLPAIPGDAALRVFRKMRRHPRLGSKPRPDSASSVLETADGGVWRARPHREFDAKKDKEHFTSMTRSNRWPVYVCGSFNLWVPDTGGYYGQADPEVVEEALQGRRLRAQRNRRSAFSEFSRTWVEDESTLPCLKPRIAFRDDSRSTDSRTLIAALVPGQVVLVHMAPYLLWPMGNARDQAYVLGVLCSMPLDWFTRRVVERHVTYTHFNSLPIPRPVSGDPCRLRTIEIAGRLATAEPDHHGFREWAAAVGVEAGSVGSEAEKGSLIAELDAVVAHLYELDEDDLSVIYETFHTGADYSERHSQVLRHFRALERTERADSERSR